MNVLLTGGAGYIGSVLTRELLNAGYNVTVFDTFYFGEKPLEDVKENIQMIKGDIRKMPSHVLEGVDAVIDLAAIPNDPVGDLNPVLTHSINHNGRVNVARLCKKMGVKQYIAPSSGSNYGMSDGWVDETTPANPLTVYSQANYAWEQEILPLSDKNFCVTIIRQSTVYGYSPKMRFDIIVNDFTMQAFANKKIKIKGNGMEWRPFVHIKDDCQAMLKILSAPPELINGELFNIGSNEQSVQLKTAIDKITKSLGFDCPVEYGDLVDKRDYKMSCEKIKKVLGFKAKFMIEDGAKEIYAALQDGRLKADDPTTMTLKWYKILMDKDIMDLI